MITVPTQEYGEIFTDKAEANAAYIAAANPRTLLALLDRLAAVEQQVADLAAERGVLLNTGAMVSRYAMPYFEKMDRKRPSHDTGELLMAARGLIVTRTPETNELANEWMLKMRQQLAAAEARERALLEVLDSETLIELNWREAERVGKLLRAALAAPASGADGG